MSRQFALPLPYEIAMGADDFLVTASNRDAAAWVERWPDWPNGGLILCGEPGSGKSHLAASWRINQNALAVAAGSLAGAEPAQLAAAGRVVIDDADAAAGHAQAEETLFHLFNRLRENNGSLLLTMRRGPAQAGFLLPDLRSRLLTLPLAAMGPPDDALIPALIVKQFRDRQIDLDAGVVAYVAARAPRDAAGIADIVDRLDRAALAEGRKVSIALARALLDGREEDR